MQNNVRQEPYVDEPRPSNPVELDQAINALGGVILRAQALVDRVQGQDLNKVGESDVPRVVPSLAELLSQGPSRIRSSAEDIENALSDLENILFS